MPYSTAAVAEAKPWPTASEILVLQARPAADPPPAAGAVDPAAWAIESISVRLIPRAPSDVCSRLEQHGRQQRAEHRDAERRSRSCGPSG